MYLGGDFMANFKIKIIWLTTLLFNWLQTISSDNQLLASFEFLSVYIKLQVVFFSFPISLTILT